LGHASFSPWDGVDIGLDMGYRFDHIANGTYNPNHGTYGRNQGMFTLGAGLSFGGDGKTDVLALAKKWSAGMFGGVIVSDVHILLLSNGDGTYEAKELSLFVFGTCSVSFYGIRFIS